jgi:hypothetical protein
MIVSKEYNVGYGGTFRNDAYGDWKAGDVVRTFDGPFCNAVILGFTDDGLAKLARPYIYVSLPGIAPNPLTGIETYIVPVNLLTLVEHARMVS